MPKKERRYVRQMPKIYGDLHKKPRSLEPILRWVRRILSLGIVIAVVYLLFGSSWFSVRKVDVTGAVLSDPQKIQALVPVGGSLWRLPTSSISTSILADKRIESVAISRGLPDRVRISVQERKPAMVWVSGNQTAVLDATGVAFAIYPSGQPDPASPAGLLLASLPHVRDAAALPVTANGRVASLSFIRFSAAVQQELGRVLPEMAIDHLEVTDTTYDLAVVAKQGLRVEFNTLGDAGVQARNLARLVQQKAVALNGHQVDLRIDRWAFATP
jgi:hypothetical protein